MAKIIVKAPFYKPGHKTESGQSRGGYAHYIGTREGVEILRSGMAGYIGERRGSHGLFSDEGVDVSLSKISEEIDNHPGNVWGFIITLKPFLGFLALTLLEQHFSVGIFRLEATVRGGSA